MMKKQLLKFDMVCFGLGLACGLLLSRRRPAAAEAPQLAIWEETLSRKYGAQKAALIIARAQARFAALFGERPRFSQPALRSHLEKHILPAIALYQVLCAEAAEPEQALGDLDACMEAQTLVSPMARQVNLIHHLPGKFAALRLANRLVLRTGFPEQGWKINWVEDSPACVAYNITGCFYLNILTQYGVPELTSHFCALDDLLYKRLKTVSFERTRTLGRGNSHCNFVFRPKIEEN